MLRLDRVRTWWLNGALAGLLMVAGCSEEGAAPAGDGDEGQDEPFDPAGSIDAGTKPPIVPSTDGGGKTDASELPPVVVPGAPALPNDGSRLATCTVNADCTNNLTCVSSLTTLSAGFCMDSCVLDSDCPLVEEVPSICSFTQCRFDCAGSGSGDGTCPANMVCTNTAAGLSLIPIYRCGYPEGTQVGEPEAPAPTGGTGTVPPYEACDPSHGSADCLDGARCHVPTSTLSTLGSTGGPGYCAPDCAVETDCQVPAGANTPALCRASACEFDCTAKGSICPAGMDCRDVDSSGLASRYRCRIID
ncbi:MAG TPA: hypothetical protein VFX59_17135 [Polyangiales bacterium]|nr:hypothetical protein [Polyangiales bacterium]